MRYVVPLLALGLAAPGVGAQQPVTPTTVTPQIVASARAEARVTPDRATIFIGVQTRASTVAEASADNAQRVRQILDTLRALGVPNERLGTVEYNVYPEQRYDPQRGDTVPRITGYNVMNVVRVEVQQLDRLGRLIDAALAKGANTINQLQFTSSQTDSARHVALTRAVTRARAEAEVMARAAGGRLGDLLELAQAGTEPPRPMPMMVERMAASAADTPINPGEQTISVAIVARWRFVEGAR